MSNQRSRVSTSTPHSYDVERMCVALGGYIATALLLGTTAWTVKKWMLTDDVPDNFVLKLCDLAILNGLDVRPHDLRPNSFPAKLHDELKWIDM
jgi:hypothetical protein